MSRTPRYVVEPSAVPIWASEPFRVFFPLGVAAAVFGLLLWPFHYAGWWPIFPAIQHPRMLVFGFGAAFVFGFLGTAWPRFLESRPLGRSEVIVLAGLWTAGQIAYARTAIGIGDGLLAAACLWLLLALGRRAWQRREDLPPPGFAVAFVSVGLAAAVLIAWTARWHLLSPQVDHFLRLLAYQGFLLLPLLGVGSYLFPRFFAGTERTPSPVGPKRRSWGVWLCAAAIVISFAVEALWSARWGNLLRAASVIGWAVAVFPGLFHRRAPGTKAWSLRFGLALVVVAFLCRAVHPHETFAFEHLLFLGGFSQTLLLVADRVVTGHCLPVDSVGPRSLLWRWITWLILLIAATRATADLVPSTRVSHQIYAAVMLAIVLGIWAAVEIPRLFRSTAKQGEGSSR